MTDGPAKTPCSIITAVYNPPLDAFADTAAPSWARTSTPGNGSWSTTARRTRRSVPGWRRLAARIPGSG